MLEMHLKRLSKLNSAHKLALEKQETVSKKIYVKLKKIQRTSKGSEVSGDSNNVMSSLVAESSAADLMNNPLIDIE